jgi:hypothetical protein
MAHHNVAMMVQLLPALWKIHQLEATRELRVRRHDKSRMFRLGTKKTYRFCGGKNTGLLVRMGVPCV